VKVRALAAGLLVLLIASASLAAQTLPQFSADMTMTGPHLNEPMKGKMYFGGTKFRMDMSAQGRQSVMITDLPGKVTYMLMPQQRMYMEMRADAIRQQRGPEFKVYDPANPCANQPDTTCQKVGTEMVNGRLCDKWQFTSKSGRDENRTVYIDQKTKIPIKTVRGDSVFELTNIKEGAQPADLFQVPAGYRKMDLGGMGAPGRPPRNPR
jgi:outer membrane lipoprotein-sorting protein